MDRSLCKTDLLMISFDSALLANAAEFTGKYAPYQGIELMPAPGGGVYVTSTDQGNIAFFGFDPAGKADERVVVFPAADLVKACRGIKTADRELKIEGTMGKVSTFRKSTTEVKEIPIQFSSVEFPELGKVVKYIVDYWCKQPATSSTSGSYDSGYVTRALRCLSGQSDSVCISSFDGGPMRLQLPSEQQVVLVMPQEKIPVPAVPQWFQLYGTSPESKASTLYQTS